MAITFKNDNDIIVYALEKVISYARDNQYTFLAQRVWWIASIIGLQEGLVIHIDNLRARTLVGSPAKLKGRHSPDSSVHASWVAQIQNSTTKYSAFDTGSISTTETDIHNEVANNCEIFVEQSKQERKAIGHRTRQASRIIKWMSKKAIKTFSTQMEGIDGSELRRRKAVGECQGCAFPNDREGSHKTMDYFRRKRLEKGTAPPPKNEAL